MKRNYLVKVILSIFILVVSSQTVFTSDYYEKLAQPWQKVAGTNVKYRYLKVTRGFGSHDALQWLNENNYKVEVTYILIYKDTRMRPDGHLQKPTKHILVLSEKNKKGCKSQVFEIPDDSEITNTKANPVIVKPIK